MGSLCDSDPITKKIYTYWDEEVPVDHPVMHTLAEYQKYNPEYEVGLISKTEVKQFLDGRFPFLHAVFDDFNIYTIRSNICRMAHLFLHGGFYCDSHVKILGSLDAVEVCDCTTPLDQVAKSCLSIETGTGCDPSRASVSFMYSPGGDDIFLDCLSVAQAKLSEIITQGNTKAGQYARAIHIACGTGMYKYLTRSGKMRRRVPIPGFEGIYRHFRHIPPRGGSAEPFVGYGSLVMTGTDSRAGGKHWSVLCEERDLID